MRIKQRKGTWINSIEEKMFEKAKFILLIGSGIVLVLAKSQIDYSNLINLHFEFTLFKDIVYDLSIGIFSSMILVFFVDAITERIDIKKQYLHRVSCIIQAHKILSVYIEKYKLFYYCVVTPISERDFKNIKFSPDFFTKDMVDLFKTTLLVSQGIVKNSSVQSFLYIENKLRNEIETTLRETDYRDFPSVFDHLTKFVEVSVEYNSKDAIIEAITSGSMIEKQPISDYITELLTTVGDEYYSKFKNQENQYGNLLHPYIYLAEMMKEQHNSILLYEKEIDQIKRLYDTFR